MGFTTNRILWAFSLSGLLIALGLVIAFQRQMTPEWVSWQKKGVALSIAALEDRIQETTENELKASLQKELDQLKSRPLQIIEISPFGGKLETEKCLTCHFGIEDISESHPNKVFGCVICHGGVGLDLTVEGAHKGLRGGRNPASLDLAGLSCGSGNEDIGRCHGNSPNKLLNRAKNTPYSLMATNAGIISIMRFQWGLTKDSEPDFATRDVDDGRISLKQIPEEIDDHGAFHLANSHYRKFCASCHLWTDEFNGFNARLAGCPACHAPYNKDGFYKGGDPTIKRNETGHPSTHTLTNAIPDERCKACHNRSARIGLNYHGQMESAQYGTPFDRGGLKDPDLSDQRYTLNLVPDIHFEKGMGCIDCHTGQDTMGDGVIHSHMEDQIEIRCEDCHGSSNEAPRAITVEQGDIFVETLVRGSKFLDVKPGDRILLTSKKRPMPHVKVIGDKIELTSKIDGKKHPVTVITGKRNAHTIKGHNRLECDSCHSAWTPQCYGCHQLLDMGAKAEDRISNTQTKGRWAEGRSYFRFERNILGINSRGKVGLLVPGCQVWNSVIDEKGRVMGSYDSRIMGLADGKTSIAVGPIHPHTTRTEVPSCAYCHLDPKALGLGEGRMGSISSAGPAITPIYDSKASGLKIDYPLDAVVDIQGKALQSTSHKLARPFNRKELTRILSVGKCVPCHSSYRDPIWAKAGPYKMRQQCRETLNGAPMNKE